MPSRALFFRRFIETLSIIRKPDEDRHALELIPFRFNEPQRIFWDRYIAPHIDARQSLRLIVLKARQLGISTLIQGLFAARFCWDQVVREKVIAHAGDSTTHLWEMAERMLDSSWFHPFVRKAGKTMELGHSLYGCATAGSPDATRSLTLNCLHNSEVAMWPHPDAWIAAMQTVPVKGDSWLFIESTANGKTGNGELFYDEWKRAASGKTKRLIPAFLPWHWMKEYRLPHWIYADEWTPTTPAIELVLEDLTPIERELRTMVKTVYHAELTAGQLAWRRLILTDQCRDDDDVFNQEYPSTPELAFITSGAPLFPQNVILWMKQFISPGRRYRLDGAGTERDPGRFVSDPHGYIEVWKPPEPGHQYIIGADTSTGFDDDRHSRSAAEVIDLETMEQVAEYDHASPTFVMARHLAILARRYNQALLAPEVTASGGGGGRELIVHLLKDHQYYRLYRYKHVDSIKHDPGRLWGWECLSLSAKVLTADLQWMTAKEVKVGTPLLGCQERTSGLSGETLHFRVQRLTARSIFSAPCVRLLLENGAETVVSTNHPFWSCGSKRDRWSWTSADAMRPGDAVTYLAPWDALTTLSAGRLSGLLDGVVNGSTVRALTTVRVSEIHPIGEDVVVGLTTEPDHTLIADGIVGHNTNCKTRPRMIDRAVEAVSKRCASVHSDTLLTQLQDFGESDTGRLEALSGKDDLFFAWSIALVVRSEEYVAMKREERRDGVTRDELRTAGIRVMADLAQDVRDDADRSSSDLNRPSASDWLRW